MYLFRGQVATGDTMQETAKTEELFTARNDEEARRICKESLALRHSVDEGCYKLFKEIPIEVRWFADSH